MSNQQECIWDLSLLDQWHFSWDALFGYDKTWNFAIGERDSGKSSDSWIKIFNAFYYLTRPSLLLRRRIADITSAYLDDIATLLNKFLKKEYHIQLCYLKGDLSTGIADVKVGKAGVSYSWQEVRKLPIFFRVIALSVPINRIKSLLLKNVKYMLYDEFLANIRFGEKYLGDEMFLLKEIYTTYNREATTPMRIICCGNPYSIYCPLFSGLEVDSSLLKPGAFVVKNDYAISCFSTPPELKEIILKRNPMYKFDDTYYRYAFGGESINDQNIRIHKREPRAFKMLWIFKLGKEFISVHYGNYQDEEGKAKYWVCKHNSAWLEKISKRRKIIVFSFADLIRGAVKWSIQDKLTLSGIKEAMNNRAIIYNNVDASYMLEDISVYF